MDSEENVRRQLPPGFDFAEDDFGLVEVVLRGGVFAATDATLCPLLPVVPYEVAATASGAVAGIRFPPEGESSFMNVVYTPKYRRAI